MDAPNLRALLDIMEARIAATRDFLDDVRSMPHVTDGVLKVVEASEAQLPDLQAEAADIRAELEARQGEQDDRRI